ncbi:MAG: DivIVA domain-containing protein [Clostridia bacterium]|nr:DivIVA domain-containing protein [Clostridia bacterium]
MIKPIQIRSHSFPQISRGAYKASDVDEYLTEVAAQLEEHLQEREQLVKKITMLADKVQEYRNDEDSIGAALLNAQKMAAKLTKEAEDEAQELKTKAENQAAELEARAIEKAREIISAANDKSEQMIAEAQKQHDAIVNATDKDARAQLAATKKELAVRSKELEALKAKVTELKTSAIDTYYAHIAAIKELSSAVEKEYELNSTDDFEDIVSVEEPVEETVVEETAIEETAEVAETVEEAVEETADVSAETAEEIVPEASEATNSEETASDDSDSTDGEEPDFASFKVNLENLTEGGTSDFFSFFSDNNGEEE